jgi:hypothetical protein
MVAIREFSRNFYKYVNAGEDIVVTSKGKNIFEVVFYKGNVMTNKPKLIKTKEDVMTILPKNKCLEYGCGCQKTDANLCSKHGRS